MDAYLDVFVQAVEESNGSRYRLDRLDAAKQCWKEGIAQINMRAHIATALANTWMTSARGRTSMEVRQPLNADPEFKLETDKLARKLGLSRRQNGHSIFSDHKRKTWGKICEYRDKLLGKYQEGEEVLVRRKPDGKWVPGAIIKILEREGNGERPTEVWVDEANLRCVFVSQANITPKYWWTG